MANGQRMINTQHYIMHHGEPRKFKSNLQMGGLSQTMVCIVFWSMGRTKVLVNTLGKQMAGWSKRYKTLDFLVLMIWFDLLKMTMVQIRFYLYSVPMMTKEVIQFLQHNMRTGSYYLIGGKCHQGIGLNRKQVLMSMKFYISSGHSMNGKV